uniref:Uncharacterized protein n=1 Tax=Phlebotomus papatasi TaxID=29031 RepID=A0A1B0D6N7_PHLPP
MKCLGILFLISLAVLSDLVIPSKLNREERALVFPQGSVVTFIIAIAIPVDLVQRHVFNSFNFAANYAVPRNATDYTTIPARFPNDYSRRSERSIINRKWFYRMTSNYLRNSGFNGTSCLLRTICEASETPLNQENGLHGEILQIILSPSSSIDEGLPRAFYEAEEQGKLANCGVYSKFCPESLYGHPGKPCLLRAICDEAADPINEDNGVLGDVIHIILTPSTSVREDLNPEYYKAEELGHSGDCSKYKKYCHQSLIDLISKVVQL